MSKFNICNDCVFLSLLVIITEMYKLASQIEKKLLVSMPSLHGHPYYSDCVLYVLQCDGREIKALMLNKRMQCSMQELMNKVIAPKRLSVINDAPVLNGGLVRPDEGLILYFDKKMQQFEVSASKDLLMDIAKGIGPETSQVFLGMTSWRYDDFMQELKSGHWFISHQPLTDLISIKLDKRYRAATSFLGVRNSAVFASEQAEA